MSSMFEGDINGVAGWVGSKDSKTNPSVSKTTSNFDVGNEKDNSNKTRNISIVEDSSDEESTTTISSAFQNLEKVTIPTRSKKLPQPPPLPPSITELSQTIVTNTKSRNPKQKNKTKNRKKNRR